MKKLIPALILMLVLIMSTAALAAGYVSVTDGNSTYVRTQPSLESRTVTSMSYGQSATYLGSTRYDARGVAWYNINFNGKTGWVSSRYTTLYGATSSTGYGTQYWVRTTGDVNVRTGAGTGYRSMGNLSRGATARYTGNCTYAANGRLWYQIYYGTGYGWVSSTYSYLDTDSTARFW